MKESNIKEGDKVKWNWGGGAPGGTATKVKESGSITMETKSGNEIKKKGEHDNPAVYIERTGHDVVKKASELKIESKGSEHGKGSGSDRSEADGASPKTGKERQAKRGKGKDGEAQHQEHKKQKKQESTPDQTKKPTKAQERQDVKTGTGQLRRSNRLAAASK